MSEAPDCTKPLSKEEAMKWAKDGYLVRNHAWANNYFAEWDAEEGGMVDKQGQVIPILPGGDWFLLADLEESGDGEDVVTDLESAIEFMGGARPKKGAKRFTEKDAVTIKALVNHGYSDKQIAPKFNCGPSVIMRFRKEHGLYKPRKEKEQNEE